MLLMDNRAYLCDFGISNILDNVKGLTTDPHGAERWVAPEQLQVGPVKANIWSDMYSFGSLFLEVS